MSAPARPAEARYHECLGHDVPHLQADGDGLTPAAHRAALERVRGGTERASRPDEEAVR